MSLVRRYPRYSMMEADMTDEFTDRKLGRVRAKLDAAYGPLTGRQWIGVAAALEIATLEAEMVALVQRFAVPITDLIDAASIEGWTMRQQQDRDD